jgi:hypothetical protein
MAFHVDLKALNLDSETSARISAKISAITLNEIAHLDLSEKTTIIGKLKPGINGVLVIDGMNTLSEIASRPEVQDLL